MLNTGACGDGCRDAGGTSPGKDEVESRPVQRPRAMPGAIAEGRATSDQFHAVMKAPKRNKFDSELYHLVVISSFLNVDNSMLI